MFLDIAPWHWILQLLAVPIYMVVTTALPSTLPTQRRWCSYSAVVSYSRKTTNYFKIKTKSKISDFTFSDVEFEIMPLL